MNEYGATDEHRPLTWWRGHPIYATHFVVAVYVASMVVTSILLTFHLAALLNWLIFESAAVLHGQIWRIVTYGLCNGASVQFAIDMAMMVWFGRDVEKVLGLKRFLILFACIYLISPLLLTLLGLFTPMVMAGKTGALALFVAFATLYPNVPLFFFQIPAKWGAVILVGIYTLMGLSDHDQAGLVTVLSGTGAAYVFIRHYQGRFTLPGASLFQGKPKLRVLPDLPTARKQTSSRPIIEPSSMAEVDALLDKIAQSGMASLTSTERAKLDAARDDLKKRGSSRR